MARLRPKEPYWLNFIPQQESPQVLKELKRFAIAITAALLLFSAAGCTNGSGEPSPRELKRRITELTEENGGLKESIKGLETEIDEFNSKLSTLRAERNALKKELSVLKRQRGR
jgi:peptidoglycan hydrolase CwlO-like protein